MTDSDPGRPADLGDRLIAAEGLDDDAARRRRRERMRELLEEEREFTRKIRRACIVAWALSLLLPLGWVAQRPLLFMTSGPGGPTAREWAVYLGTQSLVFVGGVAGVIGVITLVAWLFRTRSASLATLQLRIGELEESLERLERRQ